MYSHCLTCTAHLGSNRVLEAFPVARRIAFDAERGRLWALCARCRAWNLAPLEERWEAVETAERLFRTAVVGASTQQIALGRVADGTELLRVGGAEAAELAGWRYGRELVGRWRRHRRLVLASLGTAGALALLPAVGAGAVLGVYGGVAAGGLALHHLRGARPVFRRAADGRVFRERDVRRLLLVPGTGPPPGSGRRLAPGDEVGAQTESWRVLLDRWHLPPLPLERHEAERAMRAMLARWNAEGGSPSHVRRATERVLELGSPDRILARAARDLNRGNAWEYHLAWPFRDTARIQWADRTLRLALEMAVHDELERRALRGELALLEREWAEAEELAAIADDLLPRGVPPAPLGGQGRPRRDEAAVRGDDRKSH